LAKAVSDAITRSQNEFKGIALATTDALDFANQIYQIIGTATRWDWLQTAGTTFGTTLGVQDYANVPADFMGLKAVWRNDDSNALTPMISLAIREQLEKNNTRRPAYAISVENGSFRLDAKSDQTRTGTGQWAILFEYYKQPKLLTAVGDTFEFPDQEFTIFSTGFNARVAEFIKDERAGQWGGRNPIGQFVGSGMWGTFAALLNNMVRKEELASGVSVYAPTESLYM
jgi:hypothetical protein